MHVLGFRFERIDFIPCFTAVAAPQNVEAAAVNADECAIGRGHDLSSRNSLR